MNAALYLWLTHGARSEELLCPTDMGCSSDSTRQRETVCKLKCTIEVRCSPPDFTRGIRIDKIACDQSMMLFFMNVHIHHRIMFFQLFLSMPQYMYSSSVIRHTVYKAVYQPI